MNPAFLIAYATPTVDSLAFDCNTTHILVYANLVSRGLRDFGTGIMYPILGYVNVYLIHGIEEIILYDWRENFRILVNCSTFVFDHVTYSGRVSDSKITMHEMYLYTLLQTATCMKTNLRPIY